MTDETIVVKSDRISNMNKWYKFAAICVAITCVVVITLAVIGFIVDLHDHENTQQAIHGLAQLENNANSYIQSVDTAAAKLFSKVNAICNHVKGCVPKVVPKK